MKQLIIFFSLIVLNNCYYRFADKVEINKLQNNGNSIKIKLFSALDRDVSESVFLSPQNQYKIYFKFYRDMNYKFDIVNIFLIPLFPIFNESRCNNENTKIDFKIAISQHKQYGVPENGLPAMENDTKKHFIENFPEIKFIINAKFDNKHEYVIDYYKKAIKNPKYSIVSTNKNLIFPIPCNKWNKLDLKISNIFIDGEESDDINLEITKKSSVFLTIGLPH